MASEVHLIAVDASSGQIDAAVALLEHLEQVWSRFIPTSDISRINRTPDVDVTVDESTVVLVDTMIDAWRLTDGRYDPTILGVLVANGYATSWVDPTRTIGLATSDGRWSVADLVVDRRRNTLRSRRGLAIDPGGIGKGLAADLAVRRLLTLGARGALVAIGGDIAMAGDAADPDGWRVAVEHADPADGVLVTLAVSGGGIATSSTRSRRWTQAGRPRHHQIDPRTAAQSDTDLAAVTVVAPTGWQAEAHATAALTSGSGTVIAYLESRGLSGLAIAEDGTVRTTADLARVGLAAAGGRR